MEQQLQGSKTPAPRSSRKRGAGVFEPTGHARNYCDAALAFAIEVAADKRGRRHGKLERQACERFLRDLERAKRKDCAFRFDPWEGNNVCDFIEKLPHVQGTWASPLIRLEPVQCFILVNVFGFRKRSDGTRRFSDVYIEAARKFAKSTLTSGVMLYCLACEDEPGPECLIAATTGAQALKVFDPARAMVEKTADLAEEFGLHAFTRSIVCGDNDGFIKPVNSKASTQDGWNPHAVAVDELHAHKTRALHDVMRSARGSRRNPLMWRITTAGSDVHGVCYEQRTIIKNVLTRVFEADHYFGVIFTIDEGDDPFDPAVWIKANPMLGITPSLEALTAHAAEAQQSPESRAEFLTKKLNVWTTARNSRFNVEAWRKLKRAPDLAALRKVPCFIGADLSATTDLTALACAWIDDEDWLNLTFKIFIPEDTVDKRTREGSVPYRTWVEQKHLITTPGNVIDNAFIEKTLKDQLRSFNVEEVPYDPWNATEFATRLAEEGAQMVEFRQGAKSYHPAIKAFERYLLAGRIRHDQNPVTLWALGNLVTRKDENLNEAPSKKHSLEKIDPIVAALMAVGRAIAHTETVSVYERSSL